MERPRIAIAHSQFNEGGGSEATALWIAEALKMNHDVYLITMGNLNLHQLNECYGTNLKEDFVTIIPLALPYFFKRHFDALRGFGLARFCKKNSSEFDLMISTYNMMDFGRRGIQCIADFSFDDGLRRTIHRSTGGIRSWLYRDSSFRKVYLKIAKILSGSSRDGWRENLTIANSDWSAKLIKETYGLEAIKIYPPVSGEFPDIPWDKREDGFVCLARLVPEKQIDKTIEILETVREKGWNIHLHIFGRTDNLEYGEKLSQLCKERSDWVFMEGLIKGQRKLEFVAKHKFGISGCKGEAFGIAVAEMVNARCIVWVPDGGGQVETVNHPSLIYDDVKDAVNKIERVLNDKALQIEIRKHLVKQSKKFSSGIFVSEIKEVVRHFLEKNARV
jgi:glycosyltransferase involved in cell wall biosynthesis